MVENGSVLGRKWISTIPYTKTQYLTNQQISVALYSRTLLPLSAHCTRCGNRAELGHSETCNISGKYPRHNAVVRAIARARSRQRPGSRWRLSRYRPRNPSDALTYGLNPPVPWKPPHPNTTSGCTPFSPATRIPPLPGTRPTRRHANPSGTSPGARRNDTWEGLRGWQGRMRPRDRGNFVSISAAP
jgi:hypothetical protein